MFRLYYTPEEFRTLKRLLKEAEGYKAAIASDEFASIREELKEGLSEIESCLAAMKEKAIERRISGAVNTLCSVCKYREENHQVSFANPEEQFAHDCENCFATRCQVVRDMAKQFDVTVKRKFDGHDFILIIKQKGK